MKHSAFTEIVAHSTLVPEKTVAMFVRNLKSAGLLTSGARGVNAPEMTLLDLTRMLIALCATDRPSDAVEAVNRYRTARVLAETTIVIGKREIKIPKGEQLEDIMSNLLDLPLDVLHMMNVELSICDKSVQAELHIEGTQVVFVADPTDDEIRSGIFDGLRGIVTRRSLDSHALTEMSVPFAMEKADGSTWEEMTASGNAAEVFAHHVYGSRSKAGEQ